MLRSHVRVSRQLTSTKSTNQSVFSAGSLGHTIGKSYVFPLEVNYDSLHEN